MTTNATEESPMDVARSESQAFIDAVATGCGRERPSMTHEVVQKEACRGLLEPVKDWIIEGGASRAAIDEMAERILDDLMHAADIDAFRFARELDREGWDCDEALVEILRDYPSYLAGAQKRAEQVWVATQNVTVDVALGDEVEVDIHGTTKIGIADRIDEDRARVQVRVPRDGHVKQGPGQHGYIVGVENLRKLQVQHSP